MNILERLERLIANLIRTGTVDSVDTGAGKVVIKWPSGVKSRPMPWAVSSASFYAEPVAGDQAIVLSPSGDPANAIALVGVASTDKDRGNKSPSSRKDKTQAALDKLQAAFDSHVHATAGVGSPSTPTPVTNQIPISTDPQWDSDVGANFVKID